MSTGHDALSPESLPDRPVSEAEGRLRKMASNATLRSIPGASLLARKLDKGSAKSKASPDHAAADENLTSNASRLSSTTAGEEASNSQEMKRKQPDPESGASLDAASKAARRKTWFGGFTPAGDGKGESSAPTSAEGHSGTSAMEGDDATVRTVGRTTGATSSRLWQIWAGNGGTLDDSVVGDAESTTSKPSSALISDHQSLQVPSSSRSITETALVPANQDSQSMDILTDGNAASPDAGTWRIPFWKSKVQAVAAFDLAARQAKGQIKDARDSEPEAMDISDDVIPPTADASANAAIEGQGHTEADKGRNEGSGSAQMEIDTQQQGGVGSYIASWIPYIGSRVMSNPSDSRFGEAADTSTADETAPQPSEQKEMTPAERVKSEALQRLPDLRKAVGDIAASAQTVGGALSSSSEAEAGAARAVVNQATKGSWISFWGSKR